MFELCTVKVYTTMSMRIYRHYEDLELMNKAKVQLYQVYVSLEPSDFFYGMARTSQQSDWIKNFLDGGETKSALVLKFMGGDAYYIDYNNEVIWLISSAYFMRRYYLHWLCV